MADSDPPPRPVVLRYEDDWDELREQIDADRAAGLAPSEARDALVDWFEPGSHVEIGTLARRATSSYRGGDDQAEADGVDEVAADGLIAGWGRRSGIQVFVAADDPTLGSDLRGVAAASKALRVREHALAQSAPIVQILASRRLDDDVFLGAEFARFGYGVALDYERESVERIVKIAIVTGPIAEQAAVEAAWSHLVVLAGPSAAIAGHVGDEAWRRGLADAVVTDLPAALQLVGAALDHLPPSSFDPPPEPTDGDWSIELAPGWQPDLRTTVGLVAGRPVGTLGVEPETVLSAAVSNKALRLVRLCRAFRLPVIVDHAGLTRPTDPEPADVDAFDRLRQALASTTFVLERAATDRSLTADLGVRPTWSVGPVPGSGFDEIEPDPAAATTAVERAVAVLRAPPLRPDQDPRVQRMRPRTLQSG